MLENPASAVSDGRKVVATAGTAERLVSAPTKARSVAITAETNNTGVVVVGGSTVVAAEATRRGFPLAAGASVSFDVNDLYSVFLDTTVNGDGVTFVALAGG